MPTIQYPKNPNTDTAFVVQDDGTKNRALMTAPQDTSTLELPSNPNSTKGYVTVDGKKQRVILTADIGGGGGDQHNLGYYATQAALEEAHPTAEAGDWAIVGATDTVWIWDTDNSAWVDSDQKGQVTSVNGQTGAVTLTIPDVVQYSTMPTASADNLGDIIQFTGTTDANYTNGYFYKCVSDGQEPATYSWTQVDVQPAPDPLPTQTGNAGKFLTTDGTDASWSDKPLVNTATGTGSLTVGGVASTFNSVTNIGVSSQSYSYNSVLVGSNTSAYRRGVAIGSGANAGDTTYQKQDNVSIGYASRTRGDCGVAIGSGAKADANGAIQISATSINANQTNADANTFKVGNANGNFEIMSADGTVPHGRLTNAVVSNAVTIAAADWNGGTTCTKTISGLTATSVVWVAPDSASQSDYLTAGVYASAQTTDTITFTATTTPTSALTVNVIYC